MARLVGINHVAVEVGDLDDALAFFGRIFDLELRGRAGRMAFVDMGDSSSRSRRDGRSRPTRSATSGSSSTTGRHARRRAEAGAEMIGDNDFRDPWGNHFQVVGYPDIQFTKTDRILAGMGLGGLEKSERAIAELRDKGLAD